MKLSLTHYGRKGIYAYICPLTITGSHIERGDFINGSPVDNEDDEGENKRRFYQGKSALVEIELDKHPDGLYEYKEASGHKSSFGYIEVKGGCITREWESTAEMLDELKPVPELPPLEGSSRQVAWAEQIREAAIRDGILPEWAAQKSNQARDWIDNRKRIIGWFQRELDQEGA